MMAAKPIEPAPTDLFVPVSLGRVSQVIVEQVRQLIRQGRLRPGDRLPSERDLCEQFGVSRVTVREALRVLEAGGLVEIHVGARGGAFVTAPTSSQVGRELADLLKLGPTTTAEVMEARMLLEVGVVPLVVTRGTDEEIAALRRICERQSAAIARHAYPADLSAEFHLGLAACAHNTAIDLLVQSFHGPLQSSLEAACAAAPGMVLEGITEHEEIVAALERRDAPAATEVLRRHFAHIAARIARAEGAPAFAGNARGGLTATSGPAGAPAAGAG